MAQRAARIVRDENVLDGEPHVAGRLVSVLRIGELVEGRERPAETVAEMHDPEVVDVYAASTCYYGHPDVTATVRDRRREREQASDATTLEDLKLELGDSDG